MKIIFLDRKNRAIKGIVENDSDLWLLYKFIGQHDKVSGHTYRIEEASTETLRPEKKKKVSVYLTIDVEDLSFHEYTGTMRIKGIIVAGEDVGRYHTISVGIGEEITVEKKKWNAVYDRLIADMKSHPDSEKNLFIVIDGNEATVAIMDRYNLYETFTLHGATTGKYYKVDESEAKKFFIEIYEAMKKEDQSGNIIIIGPGFAKEAFVAWLKEHDKKMVSKVHMFRSSMGGLNGIYEVMNRGTVDSLLNELHFYKEVQYLKNLLYEISAGKKYAYGKKEVEKALSMKSVETLLITDELIHNSDVQGIVEAATKQGGAIFIFKSNTESGRKLHHLGGIAALLRFPLA